VAGSNENDPDFVRASQRVGQVLRGKYRIDRVIGVGGMAAVYAATHRNQKTFAVKVLHRELSFNDDIRNRFLREGYAANSVRHPGAVAVLDDDVAEDGAAFLVMELLDGSSVEGLLEQHGGRLAAAYVLGIGHQLLDTLAAAHLQGIVHRDIKPANLFLTREGQVKVLDFGIARVRDAATTGSNVTGTGVLLGTPAFMAPEQAVGKSTDIDAQTDLWTVGATLFTMASGNLVHQGETGTHLMVLAATTPARSLASVLPAAPAPLVAIVDRALSFAKAGRWPSAEAMRDALRDASLAMFGRLPLRETLLPALGDGAVAMAATRAVDAAMMPSFGLAAPGAQGVGEPPPTQPMGPSGPWVPPTEGHPSGPWPGPAATGRPVPATRMATGGGAARPVPATQMATGGGAAIPGAPWTPPMQTGPAGYPLPQGPVGPTVGMTTSQPVASEAEPSRPAGVPRSTPALLAIAAVTGFLVVGGGAFVALRSMGGSSTPDTASSAPVSLGAATGPASTAGAAPPSATALPAAAQGPSAGLSGLPAPAAPAPATPAASSAKPRPPPTPPAPVAGAVPAATALAAPVCKVVSFFDADGNKHFRQECH
jgi:serine/threonine-protein kinase